MGGSTFTQGRLLLEQIRYSVTLKSRHMEPTASRADTNADDKGDSREKRSMPNWSGSASDFFAWVEQLRSHAGYAKIDELARTFWAHFPSASRLGYEVPEPEE
ncbi:UNVERIFIED_CONTAM: hypothetical protein FKN15_067383 [Acipenser sinensis]